MPIPEVPRPVISGTATIDGLGAIEYAATAERPWVVITHNPLPNPAHSLPGDEFQKLVALGRADHSRSYLLRTVPHFHG